MVNQLPDRSVTPARILVPVGFLLAPLAAAALPVSCGVAVQGHIRVCYPGWRLVSGTPDIATPDAIVGTDMLASLQHAATLPAGTRLLAVLTALVLLAGALSGLLPDPYRRAALGTAAAAVGLVLLVITAALAAAAAGSGFAYVDTPWYARFGVGDGAGVAGGFWLAFVLVVVVGAMVLPSLLSLRYEAYFRTPGADWRQPRRPLPPSAASDPGEDGAPQGRPG